MSAAAPITMMPMTTMSVRRKLEAFSTICPQANVGGHHFRCHQRAPAKTYGYSHADQDSGMAAGSTTCRMTCV
jgi:hypothetical protein